MADHPPGSERLQATRQPALSWETRRRLWNTQGQCARQACRAPFRHGFGRHRQTGLRYCRACTVQINRANADWTTDQDLVIWTPPRRSIRNRRDTRDPQGGSP